jgi:hypothetical protein
MKIYEVRVKSESGDDYGSFLFDGKPNDDQLEKVLRENCPGEWDGAEDPDEHGPGFRGSYLWITKPIRVGIIRLKDIK